ATTVAVGNLLGLNADPREATIKFNSPVRLDSVRPSDVSIHRVKDGQPLPEALPASNFRLGDANGNQIDGSQLTFRLDYEGPLDENVQYALVIDGLVDVQGRALQQKTQLFTIDTVGPRIDPIPAPTVVQAGAQGEFKFRFSEALAPIDATDVLLLG